MTFFFVSKYGLRTILANLNLLITMQLKHISLKKMSGIKMIIKRIVLKSLSLGHKDVVKGEFIVYISFS